MSESAESQPAPSEPRLREVRYRHSPSFIEVLDQLNCSLLVSTYQAGKLGAIGVVDGRIHFSFHNCDQAMGVAVGSGRVAVGTKGQIWFLEANPQIAPSLAPVGKIGQCYLARRAHVTGGIHCHEMAWDSAGELWVVNTLFSCLSTLHNEFSFVPRWRPPFISDLRGEDRCHLNGLAMDAGRPRFVTAMSETDEPAGWRPRKESTGCILDVSSGAVVARGLAMPHSPRWKHDRLWVLNSGHGALEGVDLASGRREVVASMPGYTRGLAFHGPMAFIGLSRIRETAVFGGMPIAQKRAELKCGVGVVDMRTGQPIASLEFETGVEEIFDVQVVPDSRCTAICGPRPDQDDAQDIWIVPRPDQAESLAAGALRQGSSSSSGLVLPALAGAASTEVRATAAEVRRWVEQALVLQRERRLPEAIELLQRAVDARPQAAEIWNHLGNALQDVGRQEQALDCYRRAVEADPTFGPGLQNLGYVLVAHGRTDEGVDRLRQAQEVQQVDVNHMLIASALPVIYESQEDLKVRRARLESEVRRLADEGLKIDTTGTLIPTNFFGAYQGENDKSLHADLGRIYCGVEAVARRDPAAASSGSRSGRLRIGFLSAYFRDHTIGRLNIGRIEKLPREKIEAVVLSVGPHQDELAGRFRAAADSYVVVPRDVAAARRLIAEENLDVLFFADVGMDALTYTLAFSRMAPVQMVSWGHPVTTGSTHMDYFLSSELLESGDAQTHYTETLLRPKTLSTYYYRPKITGAPQPRRFFDVDEDTHLYICPQTLFKFHPDFDPLLADILRRDPQGQLALIEGRTANWTRQLRDRLARTMPDVVGRIRWLPALPNEDFLNLLAVADVMLDPPHFGGGNTSYEAFALGTPIVTIPGDYLRSRITRAQYEKMGLLDLVSNTPEAYVDMAVRLGTDAVFRNATKAQIMERSDRLFEDPAEVADFAAALEFAAIG